MKQAEALYELSGSQTGSRFFGDDEQVLPGAAATRFGDAVWDFAANMGKSVKDHRITFSTLPSGWQLPVRELLMFLAQPDHTSVMQAGLVRKSVTKPRGLVSRFWYLRALARWAESKGVAGPEKLTRDHVAQYRAALEAGTHVPDGTRLAAGSQKKHLGVLRELFFAREILTCGGVGFDPLDGATGAAAAGYVRPAENTTAPLPFDVWRSAVRAAWIIVDVLGCDILEARRVQRRLPRRASGTGGEAGLRKLERYVAAGGRVPLHTGFGRDSGERGAVNVSLLCRMVGISGSCFKPGNNAYERAVTFIAERAADPGIGLMGGLHVPAAAVEGAEGPVGWGAELGLGEVEHLTSVVRGASYLLLAGLTAMRDSEIQELRADATGTVDGLRVLYAVQHKARPVEGEERYWYAPEAVVRVVEVLAELSPNPAMILARSVEAGPYQPTRDIARFVEFVNASPADRVGKGGPLPFEPIDVRRGALNQQTMRRSFAVYSARYPEAELGVGIQLGQAFLRTTAGYYLDSQQKAARLFDDDRRRAANELTRAIVYGRDAIVGEGGRDLNRPRAMVVEDPKRAERQVASLADHYHLGAMNDCYYRPELAACGTDGPHMAEKYCTTTSCHNAVITERHRGVWERQLNDIDAELDREKLHPLLREQLQKDRGHIHGVLVQLGRTRRSR